MKKKLITVLTLLFIVSGISSAAPSTVKVVVNGNTLITDTPSVIRNSRTMVPFRALFESLGAKNITWDEPTQMVTGSDGITNIQLIIGSYDIIVNGKSITMDTPPMIINSRTMIPLSAVSSAMGAKVEWNGKDYVATVTKNNLASLTNEDINNSVTPLFGDITNGQSFTTENTSTSNTTETIDFTNINTDNNKEIVGYYAMQDLKRNKYLLNLKQDGVASLINMNNKNENIGTYSFSTSSMTLNITGFNNVYDKEAVEYNGSSLLLMKERNNPTSGSTFVLIKITQSEFDKYSKK